MDEPGPSEAAREALEVAYLKTTYRVFDASGPVDIRVGVNCEGLVSMLDGTGVDRWAFLTASNPGSRLLTDCENATRNVKLETQLREADYRYLPGSGIPDGSLWKSEASFLVFGMSKQQAVMLARCWGQIAIVCGDRESLPELLWID